MTDYFSFFNLPVQFFIDEAALRKQYMANSRRFHPDFYTMESEEIQQEMLAKSTTNNLAYTTLADFDSRLRYILEIKNALPEEGKYKSDPAFLMEMMDWNDAVDDLKTSPNPNVFNKLLARLESQEAALLDKVRPVLEAYDGGENLDLVKEYYVKRKYYLRIRENLSNFAP